MKLVDLIRTLSFDDALEVVEGGINCLGLEKPEIKIRLCFSYGDHPEFNNVVLPVGHPALIAWYDYEVSDISVPQKNLIEVYFSYCCSN